MKRRGMFAILLGTLLFGTAGTLTAQTYSVTGPRTDLLMFGAGLGVSGFYPGEVNDYMDAWLASQPVADQTGFTAMVMNFVPRIAVVYGPVEFVQFEAFGEIGWGPKLFLVDNGSSEFFSFTRYSGGLMVKGHLPLDDYRKSLFLGAGAEYDFMSFDGYTGSSIGYRGELGFRMYWSRTAMDIFLAGLLTRSDGEHSSGASLELNYSSAIIGATFYFMPGL